MPKTNTFPFAWKHLRAMAEAINKQKTDVTVSGRRQYHTHPIIEPKEYAVISNIMFWLWQSQYIKKQNNYLSDISSEKDIWVNIHLEAGLKCNRKQSSECKFASYRKGLEKMFFLRTVLEKMLNNAWFTIVPVKTIVEIITIIITRTAWCIKRAEITCIKDTCFPDYHIFFSIVC